MPTGHNVRYDWLLSNLQGGAKLPDPGDGNQVSIDHDQGICELAIGSGAETRTLPSAASMEVGTTVHFIVDQITGGGTCAIEGVTLGNEGDSAKFMVVVVNGAHTWLSTRGHHASTDSVILAVDSATVISVGDLVYLDTDDAKPASSQTDQGTESANQEVFHDRFAGVALEASANGDTDPIRVATTGVFKFASPSATYEVGDLVGSDENAGGNGLLDQTVVSVATPNLAVGRVSRREAASTTEVLVEVVSTVMKGGPQAAE